MPVIGIYTNANKDKDLVATKQLIQLLEERNICFVIDEQLKSALPLYAESNQTPDILIVLGGDGTILSAARKYAPLGSLIFGINLGRMGFLLDTERSEMERAIDAILSGNVTTEDRLMLSAKIISGTTGETLYQSFALNEAVVSQKKILKLINIDVTVNGHLLDSIYCDGVIVSTPTGSTGYSMSAGGPIVFPTLDVLLITPVCPHSLTSTHTVLSSFDAIAIYPKAKTVCSMLSIDGQESVEIGEKDYVLIKSAGFKARFIRYTNKNFFSVLKEKFSEWSISK